MLAKLFVTPQMQKWTSNGNTTMIPLSEFRYQTFDSYITWSFSAASGGFASSLTELSNFDTDDFKLLELI